MEASRSTSRRWTYAEFARLPSGTSTRYEIVAGELVVTPAPGRLHQRIVTDLVTLLNTFVRANHLGQLFAAPFDVLFAEGDYMEPDIVFVGNERLHLLTDRGVEGPPDLVVEVVSPSTADRDRGFKLERYRRYGVPEYWVVDPEARTIEVWFFAKGADGPLVLDAGGTLGWEPPNAEGALEVSLEEVFRGASGSE